MPDLRCANLQEAQDILQDLTGNFFASNSIDETGKDRFQIVDRNWTVVRQDPAPGSPIERAPDLYVLKDSEAADCERTATVGAVETEVPPTDATQQSETAPTNVPAQSQAEPTVVLPTAPPLVALTPIAFNEIAEAERSLTDIKWDRFTEETEQTRTASRWVGTVIEVDDKIFGSGYYVHVDMNGDQLVNVDFDVTESVAFELDLGQRIEFSGTIDDIISVFGPIVSLNDVTIH